MPRGSNSTEEQDRIASKDKLSSTRTVGMGAGTGAAAHEKEGYGGGSMQKNQTSKDSL